MRKKLFLLTLPIVLFAFGCSTGTSNLYIKQNLDKFAQVIPDEYVSKSLFNTEHSYADGDSKYAYANYGLVISKLNEYFGFYSTFRGDDIIPPIYSEGDEYKIFTIENFGAVGFVFTSDENLMFDVFGNVKEIFFDASSLRYSTASITLGLNNMPIVSISGINYNLYYGDNYQRIDESEYIRLTTKDVVDNDNQQDDQTDFSYKLGDLYVGSNRGNYFVDGQYGYNYVLSDGILTYSILNLNGHNSSAGEVEIPWGYKILGRINSTLFFARLMQLPQGSSNYKFSRDNELYDMSYCSFNFKSKELKEFQLDYVVTSIRYLNDTYKDVDAYSCSYYEIFKNKILSNDISEAIVEENNLTLGSKINAIKGDSLYSLNGRAYYNAKSNVLYNHNLEFVTNLQDLNPVYNPSIQCFVGRYNGKYGLVGVDGRVKLPFEYDSLFLDTYDGENFFCVKDGNLKIISRNYNDSFTMENISYIYSLSYPYQDLNEENFRNYQQVTDQLFKCGSYLISTHGVEKIDCEAIKIHRIYGGLNVVIAKGELSISTYLNKQISFKKTFTPQHTNEPKDLVIDFNKIQLNVNQGATFDFGIQGLDFTIGNVELFSIQYSFGTSYYLEGLKAGKTTLTLNKKGYNPYTIIVEIIGEEGTSSTIDDAYKSLMVELDEGSLLNCSVEDDLGNSSGGKSVGFISNGSKISISFDSNKETKAKMYLCGASINGGGRYDHYISTSLSITLNGVSVPIDSNKVFPGNNNANYDFFCEVYIGDVLLKKENTLVIVGKSGSVPNLDYVNFVFSD